MTLTVASEMTGGSYVDLIGFAVFELTDLSNPNSIFGRAVSRVYADPNDRGLFRAERPRIVPW